MKAIKKIISITLIIALIGVFYGCKGDDSADKTTENPTGNANAATIKSADDLWGKKIGVQLGTTGDIFASDYEDAEKASKAGDKPVAVIERYNKGADAVLALAQGKLDCVIIDNEPAKAFVAAKKGLKILEEEFSVEEYAIAMKKGSELKSKINTALAELKADGTIDKIINNYIGDETKGKTPYTSPEGIERPNGTLTIGTEAQFPPYEFIKNQKFVGIDIDLAQAIADKLGMTLKIEDMQFNGIIDAINSGKVDVGVAAMTVTEERLLTVDFSDSYTISTQVMIVKE
ncbi:MAG: Arginine-binding extracellular protein ArtP precursor [Firmicutes bacterium ADurb.Bin300]|nr:MAG: Arginine-binding extracellular protein ArtP precursor [Firmicutes bacterium ADurb.Bin300]